MDSLGPVSQISIIIAAVVLLLRELRQFHFNRNGRDRRVNGNGNGLSSKQAGQLHDLHKWHDVTDQEGRPIWYVPRSIETHLEKVVEQGKTANLLLAELVEKTE